MRIAISTAAVGSSGGMQRNVFSISEAMSPCRIEIYTNRSVAGDLLPRGDHVRIVEAERHDGRLVFSWGQNRDYDVYIYLPAGNPPFLGDVLSARRKMVIPNGHSVRAIEQYFDVVACQAKDGTRYLDDLRKQIILPPPVFCPVDTTTPVEGLPDRFLLTVFNPYQLVREYSDGRKPYKGYDLVYELADDFSIPLVWCHSDLKNPTAQHIHAHPNVIHLHNLRQTQLYDLYARANAYVSFSREEGFGWAVADAMLHDLPVISRRIGVISSLAEDPSGLMIYEDTEQLRNLVSRDAFPPANYNKDCFSAERFKQRLMSLVD